MLNELYHLSIALERAGIMPVDWHKDLKPLPNASDRKPCHRIFISPDGSIAGIEPMKKELVVCLRKWESSLGNSFPGFNIQPLYRIADEDKKKRLKKWRDGKEPVDRTLLREWCAEEKAKNWDAKANKKMDKCLGTIPQELREKCADMPNDFAALKNLFERITKLGNGRSAEFFQLLASYIWRALEKDGPDLSLLSVLIHEGSSRRRPEDDRGSVSVFLDIPDWKEYPVAHEKTIKCINECLLKSGTASSTKNGDEKEDAFGLDSGGDKNTLPEVRLPYIGRVILRAMARESPCQYRYGTVDAVSFRIGADSRKRVKGALEWLSDKTREGETWGRADGKELLFAYPTVIPKATLKLAACFGAWKIPRRDLRITQKTLWAV
jgi:hypothetical protein